MVLLDYIPEEIALWDVFLQAPSLTRLFYGMVQPKVPRS